MDRALKFSLRRDAGIVRDLVVKKGILALCMLLAFFTSGVVLAGAQQQEELADQVRTALSARIAGDPSSRPAAT